jgi:hypothetical protein
MHRFRSGLQGIRPGGGDFAARQPAAGTGPRGSGARSGFESRARITSLIHAICSVWRMHVPAFNANICSA